MNDKPKIYVAAIGMITPVGANTKMTVAAINAGISRYQASEFFNKNNKPMTTSCIPEDALPPLNEKLKWIGLTCREKRMVRLATPALLEVMSECLINKPIPLFLAGPENLPGGTRSITKKILSYLKLQTGVEIDLSQSHYLPTGRSGAIEAIELAFSYFDSLQEEYALIGGIDSNLDPALLSLLDTQDRVLAENINNGFVPGEAAAFLLLSRSINNRKYPVSLYRPGLAAEDGHLYSEMPYKGEGLSRAFKLAISNGNGHKINTILSSMNGENLFSKEYGIAAVRVQSNLAEDITHIHPADCYGDIGASTGTVLIGLSIVNNMNTNTTYQNLIYCSSDLANRSAICISGIS